MRLTDIVNGWDQSTRFEMDTVMGTNRVFGLVIAQEVISGDTATMMMMIGIAADYGEQAMTYQHIRLVRQNL
jgi:hypothetical protein